MFTERTHSEAPESTLFTVSPNGHEWTLSLYVWDASGDSAEQELEFVPTAGVRGSNVYIPELGLTPGRPNPSNAWASWDVTRATPGIVSLRVVGVDGRRLRTWTDRSIPPGTARVWWDGRDDHGVPVPSGRYYLVVTDRRGSMQSRSETIIR